MNTKELAQLGTTAQELKDHSTALRQLLQAVAQRLDALPGNNNSLHTNLVHYQKPVRWASMFEKVGDGLRDIEERLQHIITVLDKPEPESAGTPTEEVLQVDEAHDDD